MHRWPRLKLMFLLCSLFHEYGAFTTSLRGVYYTAEDVGVLTEDMMQVQISLFFCQFLPLHTDAFACPFLLLTSSDVCV